jgi:outer membrane autotransporter protein
VNATGGRSGTFATVTTTPLFATYITPDVSYDANNVYLSLDPTPSANPSTTPAPIFASGQQVPDALTAMVSAAEGVGDVVLGDVCGAMAQRMTTQGNGCATREVGDGFQSEVWARGLGGLGSVNGSGTRSSFSDDYGGLLIGTGIGRGGFTAGFGGGYLATALNFSDGSKASQNAGLGFAYGRYVQGPMWLGAMAAYAGGKISGNRMLAGTGLAATGSRGADFTVVQTRAAYDLPLGAFTLEPRATLAYIHAGQAGFTETGASLLDLTYAATHTDVTEGRLAVRAMQSFTADTWSLLPWAEAGMQQMFSGLSRTVLASAGTASAGVAGVSPAPLAGTVGIGLTASASQALDLFLTYQAQLSVNQISNAFSAGLVYRF